MLRERASTEANMAESQFRPFSNSESGCPPFSHLPFLSRFVNETPGPSNLLVGVVIVYFWLIRSLPKRSLNCRYILESTKRALTSSSFKKSTFRCGGRCGGRNVRGKYIFQRKRLQYRTEHLFSYHWPLAAAALVSAFRFLPPLVNEKSFSRKKLSSRERGSERLEK